MQPFPFDYRVILYLSLRTLTPVGGITMCTKPTHGTYLALLAPRSSFPSALDVIWKLWM